MSAGARDDTADKDYAVFDACWRAEKDSARCVAVQREEQALRGYRDIGRDGSLLSRYGGRAWFFFLPDIFISLTRRLQRNDAFTIITAMAPPLFVGRHATRDHHAMMLL